MRLIDVSDSPIRSVAISPDCRFVGACGLYSRRAVFEWASGERVHLFPSSSAIEQLAFCPGARVACVHRGALDVEPFAPPGDATPLGTDFAGGTAVSPDGRMLVAIAAGGPNRGKLLRWALPTLRPQTGFENWPPFRRLAFSPNGDYLAGIWSGARRAWRSDGVEFEIRFARSGGLDFHHPPMTGGPSDSVGFVSFARDSGTCAFGWEREFHVVDTSTGTSRYVRRVEAPFRDAAFTGSGRAFATVEDTGLLKLWDVKTWQVVREYDWGCGPLTCVAFTADGSAGVCGTADGRLVQFDVDE